MVEILSVCPYFNKYQPSIYQVSVTREENESLPAFFVYSIVIHSVNKYLPDTYFILSVVAIMGI